MPRMAATVTQRCESVTTSCVSPIVPARLLQTDRSPLRKPPLVRAEPASHGCPDHSVSNQPVLSRSKVVDRIVVPSTFRDGPHSANHLRPYSDTESTVGLMILRAG